MRINLRDAHAGHAVGAELFSHLACDDLHRDRQPCFPGFQAGIFLIADSDFDDREKPLGAAREFHRDRHRDFFIFRQLMRQADQVGDIVDRLAGSGFDHVVRLQIRFRLAAGPAGAERGDEHAVATGEFHFLGGHERNVFGGQSPLLEFGLSKYRWLAFGSLDFKRHFLAGAQYDCNDFLANRNPGHHQI